MACACRGSNKTPSVKQVVKKATPKTTNQPIHHSRRIIIRRPV